MPVPPLAVLVTTQIPEDGALLIHAVGAEPFVQVTDQVGNVVEGTMTRVVPGYYAWKPLAPLQGGGTYQASLSGGVTSSAGFFSVGAPFPVVAPEIDVSGGVANTEVVTNDLCCRADLTGTVSETCAPTLRSVRAHWTPQPSSPWMLQLLNQFVYQWLVTGAPVESRWMPWVPRDTFLFETPEDEYCGVLLARHIVTQQEYELRFCSDAPPAMEPGDFLIDYSGALDAAACPVPNDAFADQWCAHNAALCDALPRPDACAAYGELCLGEMPPPTSPPVDPADLPEEMEPPVVETPVDPRVDPEGPDEPFADPNSGPPRGANPVGATESESGCACGFGRRTPGGSWAALTVLLSIVIASRRRRPGFRHA